MTDLDDAGDPQALPEEIVHWQPHEGRTFGLPLDLHELNGPMVATAAVGVLAMIGLAAGAFLLGRMSAER